MPPYPKLCTIAFQHRLSASDQHRNAANQNDPNLYRSTRLALPALPDNRLSNGQFLRALRGILWLQRGRP